MHRIAQCQGWLHARSEAPLVSHEVTECHECYVLGRAETERQVNLEADGMRRLWRDIQAGRYDPRTIWGHPRVREILGRGFGEELKQCIQHLLASKTTKHSAGEELE